MKKKIKVLIVDDSAIVRQTLTEIFDSDPGIEVIGTASNPYIAVKRIQKEVPDVISLDIEMPGMDGLTFLRKLMAQHPIPVVIISTLTQKGSDVALEALSYGAAEIVGKPKIHTRELLQESTLTLCDAIKAAYHAKLQTKTLNRSEVPVPKKYSADVILQRKSTKTVRQTADKIVAIGASTGGTKAVEELLNKMNSKSPGVVVVQHMPELFTQSFARRLDSLCEIRVKEAQDGDVIEKGLALIAPGNRHMIVTRECSQYKIRLDDGPMVNRHRPSVDVLFRSVAQNAGRNSIGVILTGMGNDGALGLLELRESGALTIAQDEESCVVFGMPKEAIKSGAVDLVLPLKEIAPKVNAINEYLESKLKISA